MCGTAHRWLTVSAVDNLGKEAFDSFVFGQSSDPKSMKTIKTYPTSVEADLARIALDAAGIPSFVVGISLGMEGGGAGVQLLVPDDRLESALLVLGSA